MPRLLQYNLDNVAITVAAFRLSSPVSFELTYYLIDADKHLMTELSAAQAAAHSLPKSVASVKAARRALETLARLRRAGAFVTIEVVEETQALDFYQAMLAIAAASRKQTNQF